MPAIQTENSRTIAPHYFVVNQEFRRLHDKLSCALRSQVRPHGPVVQDGLAALRLWQRWLQESADRLPGRLRRFSATILAPCRRPDQRRTMVAVIGVEQEVNRLIHLRHQLAGQPLAACYEEGRRLLLCCLDNLARDLLDLFAFFTHAMAVHSQAAPNTPRTHVWTRPLTCGPHWSAYQTWHQACVQATRPNLGSRHLPLLRRHDTAESAPGPMPATGSLAGRIKKGFTYLITREKNRKAPCCC